MNWAAQLALFVFVGAAVYFASSLTGQVMVEKARREGIWARQRALEARKAESLLRARLDALTSLGSVESWALSHGFVASDRRAMAATEARVAQAD